MELLTKNIKNYNDSNDSKKYSEEPEQYKMDHLTTSFNPEEDISNLLNNIIFKTNTNTVKYPKVRK
jgi:hypothetical protein